jgi:hypothetical protein
MATTVYTRPLVDLDAVQADVDAAVAAAESALELAEPVHFDTKAELLAETPAEGVRAVADDTGEPFTFYAGEWLADTGVSWSTAGGEPDDAVGNDADLALDTDSLGVFQRIASAYELLGYLKASGATEEWFSGSGVPSAALGDDGDFYIDTSAKVIYRKSLTLDYSDMTLGVSPRLYLRLEETSGTSAADSSAYANHGTYAGSPTLAQTGPITGEASNNAVSFDGVDDKVTVPHNAAYNVGGVLTLEFWIKVAALPGADKYVISKDSLAGWRVLLDTDGHVRFEIATSGGAGFRGWATPAAAIGTGSFHHCVFVLNGVNSGTWYVNGVAVTTTASGSGTWASDTTTDISIANEGGTTWLAAHLDEVALYPTAQSAAWVASHYAARTATASAAWSEFARLGSASPRAIYRSTFDGHTTASAFNLISQAITAGTLETSSGILVTVEGRYLNNSGAGRGLTLLASLGGTTLWSDATAAGHIPASANARAFYWQMLIQNEASLSAQRMAGHVRLGATTVGSVAGIGDLDGTADLINHSIGGTSAVNTANDQTLLLTATHSASNANLRLHGTVTVVVL